MVYDDNLRNNIIKTIGKDPDDYSISEIRKSIEDLQTEITDMVFGHIGRERVTEDIIITYTEANSLFRVRELYDSFMLAYEFHLDNKNEKLNIT